MIYKFRQEKVKTKITPLMVLGLFIQPLIQENMRRKCCRRVRCNMTLISFFLFEY